MSMSRSFVLVVSLALTLAAPCSASDSTAKHRVEAALAAMGGVEKLRALKTIHVEEDGRRNALEQSERPEGPWIAEYQKTVEDRDLEHGRLRRTTESRFADYSYSQTLVVADGVAALGVGDRFAPGPTGAEEALTLAPERVLLTALDAADLASKDDVTLQGVPHHVVAFAWKGAPVTLFLNADTGLLTAVESRRPYAFDHFAIWGDVTTRSYYSVWQLNAGGIRYPFQTDVERDGMPALSFFVTKFVADAPVADSAFAIPDDVKAAYRARVAAGDSAVRLGRPDRPPVDVAPGVVQIPGGFNVELVRQDDGVVVIESPVSSVYSTRVFEECERRFPGVPVKAVVTTSDAWPHFGGVREYVARGVPVYALDRNVPILRRLLAAPFVTKPDSLARSPRDPKFEVVSKKTTIGSGDNRLELYPIRTETGERQMMVYLPGRHVLYASDLAQPFEGAGPVAAEYYDELRTAAAREGIAFDTVFAMHMPPTPWRTLLDFVDKTVAPRDGLGRSGGAIIRGVPIRPRGDRP